MQWQCQLFGSATMLSTHFHFDFIFFFAWCPWIVATMFPIFPSASVFFQHGWFCSFFSCCCYFHSCFFSNLLCMLWSICLMPSHRDHLHSFYVTSFLFHFTIMLTYNFNTDTVAAPTKVPTLVLRQVRRVTLWNRLSSFGTKVLDKGFWLS